MSNIKSYKRGEYLFKEGEKITHVCLLQSGGASLTLARTKKNIEIITITGSNHVLGESAIFGAATHPYSAMALSETKVMELPLDVLKGQVEASGQVVKVLVKSMTDKLKVALSELRSLRSEKDPTPCPDDQIQRVFGAIFHTANHKGERDEKNKDHVTIDWPLMKQYAQRIFGESPRRLEQALTALVKLKLAAFEMGKAPDNPDGPDEIVRVQLFDLPSIEAMFEFYQYYYFKNGRTELLRYDEIPYTILSHFIKLSEGLPLDRFGAISLEYSKVMDSFKDELGINLNTTHFDQLEKKGIFFKRNSKSDGTVAVSFELKEFLVTQKIWRILREIDKWNEKGFVDLNEEEKPKRKPGAPGCPQCNAELVPQAKFCSECGAKITLEKAS